MECYLTAKSGYGLTETEIGLLEEVDRLFLRQVFNVAGSCPTEALYLELGCVPIGIVIKSRRINYLHHLSTRNTNEMIYNFFMAQWKHPARRNEWTEQTKTDLEEFGIDVDLHWITSKSKLVFKKIVKTQARELALQNLLRKKEHHSKMINLSYTSLEMQEYLMDPKISINQAKTIFRIRTRMEKFGENFKCGQPTKPCPLCQESTDTQSHSFQCRVIQENITLTGNYMEVFSPNMDKKLADTIENIVKFREDYMED